MNNLIFISNDLMVKKTQHTLKIPLTFVSYGYMKGKMYKHFRSKDTFVLPSIKPWNGNIVYGCVFLLQDKEYFDLLDAYHGCSLSRLNRNHSLDLHHRIISTIVPISFESLSSLGRLKYTERSEITCQNYIGNVMHPNIKRRTNKTHSYRITDGINKDLFTTAWYENQND